MNADASGRSGRKSGAYALPDFGTISDTEKGSERKRSGPFYISSHAVIVRLACLSVILVLVIFNVTPRPE